MAELKRIDLNKGVFEANGHQYHIEGALSIERYAEFQILEKEMGYGMTFKGIYDKLEKIYTQLNKLKFADAAVELNNIMRGVAKLEEREPVVLKICALFINRADEDRTTINQDVITQKIADWKAEGVDMRDFFLVASNSVNGYLEIYKTVTHTIMGEENAAE